MNTIFLDHAENIRLTYADNIRAFGGEYLSFEADAARVEVTAEGLTLVGYFYAGGVTLSVLPILRQHFKQLAAAPLDVYNMNETITYHVAVFNESGTQLNDAVTEFSNLCAYVAAGTENYTGQRFITYNPNAPAGTNYITFFASASATHFTNTAGAPFVITAGAGLRSFDLSQFVTNPSDAVLQTDEAVKVDGDNTTINQRLKIYAELDNRKENVLFLRWIDNAGIRHGRTFSRGGETTTGASATSYTPTREGNGAPLAPVTDKNHGQALEFGDEAIKEIYLHELQTLVTSPKVEYFNGAAWERVTLQDTAITHNRREHVLTFNASLTKPNKNVIQW